MEGLGLFLVLGLIISALINALLMYVYFKEKKSSALKIESLEEKNNYSHFPELNPYPILRFDAHGKLLFANTASQVLQEYWGIKKGGVLPTDWKNVVKKIHVKNEAEDLDIEYDDHTYLLKFTPVKGTTEVNVYGLDITEQQKNMQTIISKTLYDPVTQLPNNTLLLDYLKLHAERLKTNHRLFVFMITISDLPEISAVHPQGIINGLFNEIKEKLMLIKNEEATIGRPSDRSFVVLDSELFNHGQAINVAQGIMNQFNSPILVQDVNIVVQVSIGISAYPDDSQNPELILRNAKLAQSRAVASRKSLLFYQSGMDEAVQTKRKILVDLHQALDKKEMMLYYQPQWSLHKNRYVGAESLLRWRHPSRGFISPFFFITAAEESGLIVPIGKWVLQNACRDAAKLKSLGYPLKIAINLSAIQFMQDDLVKQVMDFVEANKISPDIIELEITEGVVIQEIQKTIEKMHELRKMGFSLAIDDFGTGYSSLSYLQQFPIQKLKIDRAFIKDIDTSRQSFQMTRGIVELGHSLNMTVVAEGAENKQQVALLRKMNCDIIQGYYYSKPLPLDSLITHLKEGPKAE